MAMQFEDDRNPVSDILSIAGSSALRVALLFGSAAVALAIFLTPLAQKQAQRNQVASINRNVDPIATGSVRRSTTPQRTYTIRRSVLQSPNSLCVIDENGRRNGC